MKISCRLLSYNSSQTIAETVSSIVNQTNPPDRLVLFDNGSNDQTVATFQAAVGNREAAVVVHSQNLGVYGNANTALRYDDGCEYVHLMHSDDVLSPLFYKKCREQLECGRPAVAWHCAVQKINEQSIPKGSPKGRHRYLPASIPSVIMAYLLANKNIITWPTVVFHRPTALDHHLLFDEQMRHAADWDFWMRLSRHGYWKHSPEPLLKYRISDQQGTTANNRKIETFEELANISDKGLSWIKNPALKMVQNVVFCSFLLRSARDLAWSNSQLAREIHDLCNRKYSQIILKLAQTLTSKQ